MDPIEEVKAENNRLQRAIEFLKDTFKEEMTKIKLEMEELETNHHHKLIAVTQQRDKDRESLRLQSLKIHELSQEVQRLKILRNVPAMENKDYEEEEEEEEEEDGEIPIEREGGVERTKAEIFQRIVEEKKKLEVEEAKKMLVTQFTKVCSISQYVELKNSCGFSMKSWKRLLRGTKNGFSPRQFHKKCDGINGTLLVVKAKQKKKEIVFGGFNPKRWDEKGGTNQWFHAPGTYLFGFDEDGKIVKFMYDGKGYAIRCNPHMGPTFGGPASYALRISNDCNESKTSSSKLGKSTGYDDQGRGEYFLAGGKANFKVIDYEVFGLK